MKKVVINESKGNIFFTIEEWEKYLEIYNKYMYSSYEFIVLHNHQECVYRGDSLKTLENTNFDNLEICFIPKNMPIYEPIIEDTTVERVSYFRCLRYLFVNRECPSLIELVETCESLQERGFRIVEIPRNLLYYINMDKRNGEVIEEVHRIYTSKGWLWKEI
jgi:hypothetical protein